MRQFGSLVPRRKADIVATQSRQVTTARQEGCGALSIGQQRATLEAGDIVRRRPRLTSELQIQSAVCQS